MDYEKKYNEALEVMRQWIAPCHTKEQLDTLKKSVFPELTENEDEKVKKTIRQLLETAMDAHSNTSLAKPFIDALAWLEKQKENPKSSDSIPSDCTSDAKCEDRWHKVSDSLPDNPREVLCKDEAGNYFIGRYYTGEGWEISNYDDEDKPHHLNPPVSKWIDFPSEKQKEPHKRLRDKTPWIVTAKEELAHAEERLQANLEELHRIRAEKEKQKERVPENEETGTRKEQKPKAKAKSPLSPHELYDAKIEGISQGRQDVLDHPEQFGLQKPVSISCGHENDAEWSGDDEEMLDIVLTMVDCSTVVPHSGGQLHPSDNYKKDISNWLKSLRPQYHGDVTMTEAYKMGKEAGEASRWKPSEVHLSALLAIFNDPNNIDSQTCQLALTDLYEQLKKL